MANVIRPLRTHAHWFYPVATSGLVLAAGTCLALLPVTWLVFLAAGTLVAGATLLRPQFALLLLCFAIPFGSPFEVSLGGITVGVTEGLVGLMLLAWAARAIALKEPRWSWPRLSLPVALFAGAASLSLLNAEALPFSLKEIAKWVEFLGVMLFVANAIDRKQSHLVVAALLLAGLAQATLGAYQFFTQSGPDFFVLKGRFLRAYGTFEQPNPYAGYLGLLAPLALAIALSLASRVPGADGRRTEPIPVWLKWLALGVFVAVSIAIGMSWSRGAWLGYAAACVAVVIIQSRRRAILLVLLLALLAVGGLLGSLQLLPDSITNPVAERLTSFIPFVGIRDVRAIEVTDDNYAAIERLAHWQAALDMWRDHLWLGVGIGNYEAAYDRYALPKWSLALGHAHNYYLNIAAEAGLLGLTAYLSLWGAAFWQIGWVAIRSGDCYITVLAAGAFGTLVYLGVHNVVDNLWVHNLYIQVAIILGLVQSTRVMVPRSSKGASA